MDPSGNFSKVEQVVVWKKGYKLIQDYGGEEGTAVVFERVELHGAVGKQSLKRVRDVSQQRSLLI
jgi:hypothetical protein